MTQGAFRDRVFHINLMDGTQFTAHMRLPEEKACEIDQWVKEQEQTRFVRDLDIYNKWFESKAIFHRDDDQEPALTIKERGDYVEELYFRNGANYRKVEKSADGRVVLDHLLNDIHPASRPAPDAAAPPAARPR